MREILFRGKAIKDINPDLTVNTQWVYGYYAKIKPCTGVYGKKEEYIEEEIPKIISGQEAITVKPNTIGQYTGLKDKNGKKIFEGDILRHSKNQKTMSVVWDGVESQFVWHKRKENNKHLFDSGSLFLTNRYFEIIGNIYDNPELLEDKK